MNRPKCRRKHCKNLARKRKTKYGVMYEELCNSCHRKKYNIRRKPYQKFRKDYCENTDGRLGFVCTTTIVDEVMLSVDHWNQIKTDNRPRNLVTLCACCHNYKTKMIDRKQKKRKRHDSTE